MIGLIKKGKGKAFTFYDSYTKEKSAGHWTGTHRSKNLVVFIEGESDLPYHMWIIRDEIEDWIRELHDGKGRKGRNQPMSTELFDWLEKNAAWVLTGYAKTSFFEFTFDRAPENLQNEILKIRKKLQK